MNKIDNILVSIVVPTYQPNFFLEHTISSIANQTHKYIEIIVVDDCSSKDKITYINELKIKYNFIFISLQRNSGGCAKPINEGIKISKGKYIAICAQDDFFLNNKISTQLKYIEQNIQYSMIFSDCYFVKNTNDENLIEIKTPERKEGFIFDDLILQKFYIPALSVLIKKEIFQDVGLFDENLLIEDWDMWLRIAYKYKIGYIKIKLVCYRMHSNNTSRLRFNEMVDNRIKIIKKWNQLEIAGKALVIASFFDYNLNAKSFNNLIFLYLKSLLILKSPIRSTRIVLSKILQILNVKGKLL